MAGRARSFGAFDPGRRGAPNRQAGRSTVDREPEAAEAPAEPAIHVEKSKMKPGESYRRDAVEHDPFFRGSA